MHSIPHYRLHSLHHGGDSIVLVKKGEKEKHNIMYAAFIVIIVIKYEVFEIQLSCIGAWIYLQCRQEPYL